LIVFKEYLGRPDVAERTPQWKSALARSKPNSCTKLAIQPEMRPGMICLPTLKDITIASGFIPPSRYITNGQNVARLDPVSAKLGEDHIGVSLDKNSLRGRTAN
jgi:hypothetical protein